MKKDDLLPEEKATDKAPDDDNEIQDLYDIYTAQGIKLASSIIGDLDGSNDPRVIADAILNIMNRVESDGEKKGIRFPLEVVAASGKDILIAVLRMAKIQPEESLINQVVGLIVGRYIDERVKSGKMSKEDLANMAQGNQGQQRPMGPQPPQQQQPPQMMQQGGMPNG